MESLFSSFPETNLAEWKEKLMKDLKGKSFTDLTTPDDNGINIHPFYTPENQIAGNGALFQNPNWEICAELLITDASKANNKALEALNGGASGLIFDLGKEQDIQLEVLLKEISLPHIFSCFKVRKDPQRFLNKFQEYLKINNLDFQSINCCIDFDPIADFLREPGKEKQSTTTYLSFIEETKGLFNITVDAAIYQNAGAHSVTQLGLGLAHLNEYLFWLDEQKMLPLIQKINFKTASGTLFFEEIAKLRALRILLPGLFKAYSIHPEIFISTATSDIYRSPIDTYSNILRDSISGMASVTGGCDALLIHNFDQFEQKEDHHFSERIARNQQLIFKEESYLNKVADIASDTYYIETLTKEIAEKAWQYFQEIAETGGIIAYSEKGILKEKINNEAQQLIRDYKEGKRTLIGVNKFKQETDTCDSGNFSKDTQEANGLRSLNIASEILQS